ncbi:hypothetical protein CHU98_g1242 [Xylaria longipes]|nr:hypothetical protein CHU98_g1242 [Xylaria longipes]
MMLPRMPLHIMLCEYPAGYRPLLQKCCAPLPAGTAVEEAHAAVLNLKAMDHLVADKRDFETVCLIDATDESSTYLLPLLADSGCVPVAICLTNPPANRLRSGPRAISTDSEKRGEASYGRSRKPHEEVKPKQTNPSEPVPIDNGTRAHRWPSPMKCRIYRHGMGKRAGQLDAAEARALRNVLRP